MCLNHTNGPVRKKAKVSNFDKNQQSRRKYHRFTNKNTAQYLTEKNPYNCYYHEIIQVQRPLFRHKSAEQNEMLIPSVTHYSIFKYQNSARNI